MLARIFPPKSSSVYLASFRLHSHHLNYDFDIFDYWVSWAPASSDSNLWSFYESEMHFKEAFGTPWSICYSSDCQSVPNHFSIWPFRGLASPGLSSLLACSLGCQGQVQVAICHLRLSMVCGLGACGACSVFIALATGGRSRPECWVSSCSGPPLCHSEVPHSDLWTIALSIDAWEIGLGSCLRNPSCHFQVHFGPASIIDGNSISVPDCKN